MVETYYKTLPTKIHFILMIFSFLCFISKTRTWTIANIVFYVSLLCLSFALLCLGWNFDSWLTIIDFFSILKCCIFTSFKILNKYLYLIKNLACYSQKNFFPETWVFFYRIDFLIKTRGYILYFINNSSKSANSKLPLQVD